MKAQPIYVLKDGARLGPFTEDDLLDLVESGELSYDDVCMRAGSVEVERLRQVLDWREESEGGTEGMAALHEEDEEDDEEEEDEGDDDGGEEDFEWETGPPRDANAILYAGHPSALSYPKTLILIAASIAGGIYGREFDAWWLFGGLIAALFGVSWILLQRSMRLYVITPRRVEIVHGLLAKNSNEVRIEDIRTINVHKPGLRGLFGVGTVEFASAGGSTVEVAFANVYAAHRIKTLVRRLQDVLDQE